VQGSVWDKLDEDGETQEQWLSKQLRLHRIAAKPLAENGVPPLFPGEQPSLICWAETMLPGALNDPANPAVPRFLAVVRESGLPAACGSDFFFPAATLAADGASGEKHNSAFLFDGQGNLLLRQAKRRLVPFGEYVPWRETLPFLEKLSSYTRDKYAPGREKCASAPIPATLPSPGEARREHPLSPTTTAAPLRIAFNLCIEDAHPDLAREAADAGADLLLNLTNDGWFGGTFESQMHLRLAGLRTVETRRPMLRVTNTGLTAYINPLGETRILLPEGAAAVGFCRINRLSPAPRTLFRLLGECGSAAVFCVAAFAAFAADERLRRRVAAE
jgi:apolipoprotein N-acyltransferase